MNELTVLTRNIVDKSNKRYSIGKLGKDKNAIEAVESIILSNVKLNSTFFNQDLKSYTDFGCNIVFTGKVSQSIDNVSSIREIKWIGYDFIYKNTEEHKVKDYYKESKYLIATADGIFALD